jgi:hypothetical protein
MRVILPVPPALHMGFPQRHGDVHLAVYTSEKIRAAIAVSNLDRECG